MAPLRSVPVLLLAATACPTRAARNAAWDAGDLAQEASGSAAPKEVQTEVEGEEGTTSFRRYFIDEAGKRISPWHDLPLEAGSMGEYWMVTEIPAVTKPKMEISTAEPNNPIAQDIKKGKLREYGGPIFWNYGYLPQTWEDPNVEHLGAFGDNDPVDVVEIGARKHGQGEVTRVKVLGALAMIDSGELDWKMIVIDVDDPRAADLKDVADLEVKMPGYVSGIREWFRWYKVSEGKPLNAFGLGEKAVDHEAAIEIIKETHGHWQRLRNGEVESKLWAGTA
uniref:inorganic diphosphatase n=1 Tax=Alexandrium monilatum TaxID=311494 RepID=A0A7S4SW38_9DINO|mmetsp:Transcript_30768/g.96096  ORF Transcript_30768/g.96096 Transcript_30768/m.96096 type:complete len:280 (+) Transcript_30768:61-900(+)